ncbi:MAG: alpha/beta hydrolase, partial [Bacteroidales bacterium]|nr:alpha/beta hydrolase [Bacteroidales bacterium]
VSTMTAAQIGDKIHKLVLIYPALCIPDNWNARYKKVSDIPDTTKLWDIPLSKNFFMELRVVKVYKEAAKYKKPVLIVHGSDDPVVPLKYSQDAVKAFKDARLKVIEKAGHGFKPHEFVNSAGMVRDFLKE